MPSQKRKNIRKNSRHCGRRNGEFILSLIDQGDVLPVCYHWKDYVINWLKVTGVFSRYISGDLLLNTPVKNRFLPADTPCPTEFKYSKGIFSSDLYRIFLEKEYVRKKCFVQILEKLFPYRDLLLYIIEFL